MKVADYCLGCDCIGLTADDLVQEAKATEETAKKVGARVSPWLWVLSLAGFSMAVLNRVQIGKMYGSFKAARKDLRR